LDAAKGEKRGTSQRCALYIEKSKPDRGYIRKERELVLGQKFRAQCKRGGKISGGKNLV